MPRSIRFSMTGLCAAAAMVMTAQTAQADFELIMVEEAGCVYCAQWNADVSPEYPLTPEGKAAPLRRVDLHADVPTDLEFTSRPVFSPTFILVDDGVEVTRLEGYPGEEFFWFLLGQMLDEGDPSWQASVSENQTDF